MMNDVPNAESAAEAPEELKSSDTGTLKEHVQKPEPPKEEPVSKTEEQQEPEGNAGDDDDAPAADESKGKQHRLPRWMKERLERERQVTEARTEARVREELLREAQKTQEPATNAQAHETQLKKIEDFDWDQGAYTAYLIEQALERDRAKREAEKAEAEKAEADKKFKDRVDAFEERAGDGTWDEILESPVNKDPAFKAVTDLFMGDEHDLDIALHLARNLTEAKRILALSPLGRAREIARIAENFDPQTRAETPPAPKKTTNAPPPPKTITGAGKVELSVDDPNITTEQRVAIWREQQRQKRR